MKYCYTTELIYGVRDDIRQGKNYCETGLLEFIWTGIEIKNYKDEIIVIEIENNK